MYKYINAVLIRGQEGSLSFPNFDFGGAEFWVHEFVDGKQTHLSPHGRSPGTLLLRPDCGVAGWGLPRTARETLKKQPGWISPQKKKLQSVPSIPIAHDGSMGRTVYLPYMKTIKKSTIHVDKYTLRPMDPYGSVMGIFGGPWFGCLVPSSAPPDRSRDSLDMTATLGLSAKTQTWTPKVWDPQVGGRVSLNTTTIMEPWKPWVQGSETYQKQPKTNASTAQKSHEIATKMGSKGP